MVIDRMQTNKTRDYNLESMISNGKTSYIQLDPYSKFRKKLKKNIFIDPHEWDMRENISQIAMGYPKYVNLRMGPPDIEIKREKLLLKVFQMHFDKV